MEQHPETDIVVDSSDLKAYPQQQKQEQDVAKGQDETKMALGNHDVQSQHEDIIAKQELDAIQEGRLGFG